MAEQKISKVLLKRSSRTKANGAPELPKDTAMEHGEVAVNFAAGVETFSIKNSKNEIITLGHQVKVGDGSTVNLTEDMPMEIFIDESVNPMAVEVYTKEEMNTRITSLSDKDNELDGKLAKIVTVNSESTSGQIMIDENAGDDVQMYTKAQVDAIIAKLKADNNLN